MQKQPVIQEVKAMESFYEICGNNHDSSECGQNPESSCYVGNYDRNAESATEPAEAGFLEAQQLQNPGEYSKYIHDTNLCLHGKDISVIQKTDAFMDKIEMRMQNQEDVLKSLENQVGQISQSNQGEDTASNSKEADDTDSPVQADPPTPTGEDHNIPTEPKEADTTTAASQPKPTRKDTMEESRQSVIYPLSSPLSSC
ncbi:hypothetical protein V6N11_005050 [Hibiscus sabdariffa]|uniref:Uncharacterized protein n=1 Tax=Hibiscus sabdariffa TaxID=183260 RepID=A0ABR2N658_9ROSI